MMPILPTHTRRGPCLFAWLVLLVIAFGAQAVTWRVPMTVTNNAGVNGTVEFGIHPQATAGLDAELGEVNLPPVPPSSAFDVRFLITGYEGFALDLRDTSATLRVHNLKWQAGSGGYPVTIRWNPAYFGEGVFTIADPFGGVFIPPLDMMQDSVIVIPASQSFIHQLRVEVTPSLHIPEPPEWLPIPEQKVFSGQRFPHLMLGDYVHDADTPIEQLIWGAAAQTPLVSVLAANGKLDMSYPSGWIGSGITFVSVRDPDGLLDSSQIVYTSLEPGVVRWTIQMTVDNAAQERQTLYFGVDPLGTTGLDPSLGEQNLPPTPPSSVFDVRLEVSLSFTSLRDMRENTSAPRAHLLRWQAGNGGYPVTIRWDSSILPPGSFLIQDELGGVSIPPTNMRSVSQIVIPDAQNFLTALEIHVTPEVDTTLPAGPDSLWVISNTDSTALLEWSQTTDAHFSYYEIMMDTIPFTNQSRWVWDASDDPALADIGTATCTIVLPLRSHETFFRIRAWDSFGNQSVTSNLCMSPLFNIQHLCCRRVSNSIVLVWSAHRFCTLYSIYRGAASDFQPMSSSFIGTTTDTTYMDPLVGAGRAFYCVKGVIQ